MFTSRALALSIGLIATLLVPCVGRELAAQRTDRAQKPKDDVPEKADEKRLGMTPAVACEKVTGYEDYVPLPDAALTKDDKLLLYYRPLRYKIVASGEKYQAHFVQDVRIRKRGDKKVIWSKDNVADYKAENAEQSRLQSLCMYNKIALKALEPGEYDLDIILHDMNSKGPSAEQVLRFKVKPPAAPDGGSQ